MTNISDDELRRMGEEQLKEVFLKNFSAEVTRILSSDSDTYVELEPETVSQTLWSINEKAIKFGKNYIANDPYLWVYTDCSSLNHVRRLTHVKIPIIGQQKSFMRLLKVVDVSDHSSGNLKRAKKYAVHVGQILSRYVLFSMAIIKADGDVILYDKFMKFEALLQFLRDSIKWGGKTNDFGVVYNRMLLMLKQARKEIILAPILAMPWSILIRQLPPGERIPIFYHENFHRVFDEAFETFLYIITMLESLLSFQLLPDKSELITTTRRSLVWHLDELSKLGDILVQTVTFLNPIVTAYEEHNDGVTKFVRKVRLSTDKMWEDLELLVQAEVKGPPKGRREIKGLVRLYVRGKILGYKRSKLNQYPNTSLIQIEGVNTKEEAVWYAGKCVAFIYRAKVKKNKSYYRCIWGKVSRPHGNSGIVRAKFKSNLPPKSMGARVRVFMYPSNI